ncbi:hypothetical protein [Desertimonas flava]|uniref:hypothetical protein n=1 Tax=Desertimonas flava TaxID=2064846 RepID=UPI000E34E211|nr:hypothetical protein [Desertimonas flava]
MTLRVQVDVNGTVLADVTVENVGYPTGEPADLDGVWEYHWANSISHAAGAVTHRRSDGALRLAAAALLEQTVTPDVGRVGAQIGVLAITGSNLPDEAGQTAAAGLMMNQPRDVLISTIAFLTGLCAAHIDDKAAREGIPVDEVMHELGRYAEQMT